MLNFLEFSLSLLGWTTQAQKTDQGLAPRWLITAPAPGPPGPRRGRWPCWQLPHLSQASEGGGVGWGCRTGRLFPSLPAVYQCPVLRDPCPKLPPPRGAAFCVAQVLSLNLQLSLLPRSCVSNHPHGSRLPPFNP